MDFPSTHCSVLGAMREPAGRSQAWPKFQDRYSDVIHRWCLRRGLDATTAEDITQEILIKLYKQLPSHEHDHARGRFRSWLKALVNNALTDYWRRVRRAPDLRGVGGTVFLERLGNLQAGLDELSVAIEQQQDGNLASQVVARVRARLKPTSWQAFWQTAMEQRSPAEVARDLGLTVGTIYKTKFRVKQMLLEEYHNARQS